MSETRSWKKRHPSGKEGTTFSGSVTLGFDTCRIFWTRATVEQASRRQRTTRRWQSMRKNSAQCAINSINQWRRAAKNCWHFFKTLQTMTSVLRYVDLVLKYMSRGLLLLISSIQLLFQRWANFGTFFWNCCSKSFTVIYAPRNFTSIFIC